MIKNKAIVQFVEYFLVGGVAALVEWSTFAVLNYGIHWHYLIATIASFTVATGVNYFLSRRVFKTRQHSVTKEVVLVYLVSGIGLGGNLLLMWLFVSSMGLERMLAKIVSTGIIFLWNFAARKFWVFRSDNFLNV